MEDRQMTKEELEKEHKEVLDTKQATKKYEFISFLAPFVLVKDKQTGAKGTLVFQDFPRYYFAFSAA